MPIDQDMTIFEAILAGDVAGVLGTGWRLILQHGHVRHHEPHTRICDSGAALKSIVGLDAHWLFGSAEHRVGVERSAIELPNALFFRGRNGEWSS